MIGKIIKKCLRGPPRPAQQRQPKQRRKCCSRLVEILYTQLLVAIGACIFFSIYNSTKHVTPDNTREAHKQFAPSNYQAQSEAAQRRQEALQRLEKEGSEEASEFEEKGLEADPDLLSNNFRLGRKSTQVTFVQESDWVYQDMPGEAAPIVLEQYNLIFFTVPKVGCTVWKMLFRRMMGFENWKKSDVMGLPHTPQRNGLKYLFHYNLSYASEIMTSPNWTRAIFVREPKERFLSAYLNKAIESPLFVDTCCNRIRQIYCKMEPPSIHEFLTVIRSCKDSHWNPQTERMETKYWPYINFVGHLESVQQDAKKLLQQLNVWDEFGTAGWGTLNENNASIFSSGNDDGLRHATNAKDKIHEFLHPELEVEIEKFYAEDYDNPLFNFTHSEHFKRASSSLEVVDHASLDLPLVEPRDYIVRKQNRFQGENSPVVVEAHKLVFFVVPHIARQEFKRLFHRMMGHSDWKTRPYSRKDPLAFDQGLVFLRDYSLRKASEIMTSPEWTRAIFLRDPKERFVIAYTQTATRSRILLHNMCCRSPRLFCLKHSTLMDVPDMATFLNGIKTCKSTHWDPFVERLAALERGSVNLHQKEALKELSFDNGKYWKYINFIGHMDNAYQDAESLLQRVGAWEEFGKFGWADTPNDAGTEHDAFLHTRSFVKDEIKYKEMVRRFIKDPQLERKIDKFYEPDYQSPWLNLTKKIIIPTSVNDLENAAEDIRFVLNKEKDMEDTKTAQRQW